MYDTDLWEGLAELKKPIFVYGTGNGADKIFKIFDMYGIKASGVFASDGFVRDRTFCGFHVQSYGDVIREFGDEIAVVCAFGSSRPEVIDFLLMLDSAHELFIPEVPLFCSDLCDELFNIGYYRKKRAEIEEAGKLFRDEESKALFCDMIEHRLTGKLTPLIRRNSEFSESAVKILNCGDIRYAVDGGAFRGDTVRIFGNIFPELARLAAVEPDPSSYKKLSALAGEPEYSFTVPVNAMLGCCDKSSVFWSSGSRGSAASASLSNIKSLKYSNLSGKESKRGKEVVVPTITLDEIVESELDGKIDFIKLDVEGAERDALKGAEKALESAPALAVSLYHRSGDIFELPLFLKKYYPAGRFYLRRPRCVPEWDLTLFVAN